MFIFRCNFEIKILENLLSANGDITIAIDKNSNLSGTMRVKLNKGYVIDVGNHISLKVLMEILLIFKIFTNWRTYTKR